MKNITSLLHQVAEVNISYSTPVLATERPKISSSRDAESIFRNCWSEHIELLEECYLMLLNRANQVIGVVHISKGGISGTVVDLKIILAAALKAVASGIILAHNHPSGNLQPSQADRDLTLRIRSACGLLDIVFLDHLILAKEGYYSFADEGGN